MVYVNLSYFLAAMMLIFQWDEQVIHELFSGLALVENVQKFILSDKAGLKNWQLIKLHVVFWVRLWVAKFAGQTNAFHFSLHVPRSAGSFLEALGSRRTDWFETIDPSEKYRLFSSLNHLRNLLDEYLTVLWIAYIHPSIKLSWQKLYFFVLRSELFVHSYLKRKNLFSQCLFVHASWRCLFWFVGFGDHLKTNNYNLVNKIHDSTTFELFINYTNR